MGCVNTHEAQAVQRILLPVVAAVIAIYFYCIMTYCQDTTNPTLVARVWQAVVIGKLTAAGGIKSIPGFCLNIGFRAYSIRLHNLA